MTKQRKRKSRPEIYLSCDVEADGSVPGPYSMVSIGFALAARYDGEHFETYDPSWRTFYAELKPISEQYVERSLAVSGLSREYLLTHGRDPREAMSACASWVRALSDELQARPVFVGYPAVFDWLWAYYYFSVYADGGSPFGFSGVLDMKTMYVTKADTLIGAATKRQMPRHLLGDGPHSHHALDDCQEQAQMFCRLWQWRRDQSSRP